MSNFESAGSNIFHDREEITNGFLVSEEICTYLHGAKVLNRTDYLAPTYLKPCKFVNARLIRWILAFQDYQIGIEHFPEEENVIADVLIRLHDGDTYNKNRGKARTTIQDKKKSIVKDPLKTSSKLLRNTLYHTDGTYYRIYVP